MESFLYNRSQFSDTTAFLSKYILGPSGQNDDLGSGRSNTYFNTTVTVFRQLLHEKVVQFCTENSISNKLKILR